MICEQQYVTCISQHPHSQSALPNSRKWNLMLPLVTCAWLNHLEHRVTVDGKKSRDYRHIFVLDTNKIATKLLITCLTNDIKLLN